MSALFLLQLPAVQPSALRLTRFSAPRSLRADRRALFNSYPLRFYAGLDLWPAIEGAGVGSEPAPREIISCSSSGFDERDSAVCSEISFLKYSVASDWLNVCIPYLAWPVCIIE